MNNTYTLADYTRRQQYRSGWQDLSALLCTSILAAASRNDGHDFLFQTGTQFARQFPLTAAQTLGELEDEANRLFGKFAWGFVNIAVHEQKLEVTHLAWPHAGQEAELLPWTLGFSALMEGCWSEWLQKLGGNEETHFSLIRHSPDALSFHYQIKRGA